MAHIRKLKSGKWQATIRHPSGQRYSKSDPLKRVVSEWAAEVEARMRRGEFFDPTAGKTTLTELWEKWSSTRRVEAATSAKDGSQWRVHVGPKFGSWPIGTIRSWDVEAWVTEMRDQGVGAETTAASLRLLVKLLNAAVKHQMVATNPAVLVKAPTVPRHVDRFLDHAEAERLVAQFTGTHQLFVSFLLGTGLRWSEAAALDGRHIRFLTGVVVVEQALSRAGLVKVPKSRAGYREVPLTAELGEALSRHVVDLEVPVFQQASGKRLSYTNWRSRVWASALPGAGLADPQPTPHDLRHTYGSWLGDAGMPVADIAQLMGHSDWRMTQRYVHSSEARMDRARAALVRDERQGSGRSSNPPRTSADASGHNSRSDRG